MTSQRDIDNRRPITAALMLATLMNTLDSTIANVALPHIQGSVSAAQDQIVWVLTSYIIAAAIMTPLSGWLAQKFGRKRMFLISIAGFTLASMLCGIATNLPEIVFFRLLQGIAGASMMPLSQTVMLDIYPPRQIPAVMAVWSSAVILGPIVGPALGGWLTENYSWRWVFYINLPIGILAFLGLSTFMDDDPGGRERPFDFVGCGGLIVFVGAFQLMIDRGPGQDWFDSAEIWLEGAAAVIGLWIFVIQTFTAPEPFFHRDLAKDRNFVATTIFGFFVGALLFSSSALLPSLMQNLMGFTVLQSGLASMPRGVGSLIAFIAVPFLLTRFGARPVLFVGLGLSAVALWQMSRFDLMMTSEPIMISGFIQGLGTGLMFAPLTALAYATLAPIHRTEGTIVSTMARSLGSSAGISLLQAGVIRQSALAHQVLATHVVPSDPVFRAALPPVLDPGTDFGIQALNGEVTRQASMIGYDAMFAVMIAMIVVMGPLLLLLRPPKAMPAEPVEAAH
ncbi:MAG TPA: MDR family MFS transporter [Caulobacteraceae bacterium]|jgi:DHA2 family multidrug resistance protein|nr:MDR family MFS transporter [Caulobacteraceae bacterium]